MNQGNQKPQVVRPNTPQAPQAARPVAPAAQPVPAASVEAAAEEAKAEAVAEAEAKEEAKPEGYTPQEAAQVLGGAEAGFTGKGLRRHIRSKVCPATKHGGRWYITEDQLEQYLANLEKAAEAKAAKAAEAEAAAAAAAAAEAAAAATTEDEG